MTSEILERTPTKCFGLPQRVGKLEVGVNGVEPSLEERKTKMTKRSPSLSVEVNSASTPKKTSQMSTERHELECRIQRGLQAYPGLKFARLSVHQCPQGVCLEGLLETNEDDIDLCDLVNEIAGVKAINHVVIHPTKPK